MKMGERYWITGVQLGQMLINSERDKVIKRIIRNQFLDNYPTDKDKEIFENKVKETYKT